jgi:hypothetical protein
VWNPLAVVIRKAERRSLVRQVFPRLGPAVVLVAVFASTAQAQTKEVWPEISTFVKLTDQMRLYFLATKVEESGESTGSEYGPNFDIYLKPVRSNKKHWGGFRLDESKNRLLHVRVGYRYLPSFGGAPDENRGVLEFTARYPLVRGVLVSSRNRFDLRFIDHEYSWRFRNRLSIEKELSIGRLRMNPYLRGEIYYDSQFHEWSRTEAIVGAAFPINRRWETEAYFDVQNNTGKSPSTQIYALGLVLNIYFR